jgi:superfamily I DNA/RNA helicase
MRLLPDVQLTPEQLVLLADLKPGVMLVKGAAGSGKTTTALMRLRQLCEFWRLRKSSLGLQGPVRVLVLTFNKTLRGYIQALAESQIVGGADLELVVSTFAKFARDLVGGVNLQPGETELLLRGFCRRFGGSTAVEFVESEVDYVLSRLKRDELETYMDIERTGRGVSPRAEAPWRRRLLDEVIYPYLKAKEDLGWSDWNDLAVLAADESGEPWDVVVIDETQDFSANQLRAVMKHLAFDHQVTFVMDATQRIYPRYFTWREAGVILASNYTLSSNYRNTKEIAAFARPIVEGLPADDNGALPDFNSAARSGPKPRVLAGLYSEQLDWAVSNVVAPAVAAGESVAFLQPWGGRWFRAIQDGLTAAGVAWVQLTRASDWPTGPENVAVSTLHSAKGLEFDHVVILGLNHQVTPHGSEIGDTQQEELRRLLAMGIGRARLSVTIGYKPGEASALIDLLDPSTFKAISL